MIEILKFLSKHSTIDFDFIQEFMNIQESNKTHAPFKVDLDVVAKWLDIRKKRS